MGFLTPGAVKNEDDVYDLGSTRCRLLLDKCRDLVSDNTRKINVLAIAEGFRNSEIPMLVSGCDKVTVLFSGKDFNEEAVAANLISAINRSLTHGVAVADYLKYPTAVKSKQASAAGRTTGITGAAV